MRRVFREELDSHLADLIDELGDETEARRRFGDVAAIGHQLSAIHPWLAAYGDWIIIGVIVLSCVPLVISTNLFANTIPGLLAERLLVWWWGVILALGSFVLLKWQYQLITPLNKQLIFYALSTGFIISICMTVLLDINNFETAIYNSILAIVSSVVLWLLWKKMQFHYRTYLLYGMVGLMIFFSWRETAWFESIFFPNCLYLQPDPFAAAPSQCTQLTWTHPLLFIVYLILTMSVGWVSWYCILQWKHSSKFYRKIITTSTFILLPMTAYTFAGVNQSGQLDVLPWKRDIYQAYIDILGRRPEEKDYEFYEKTRSYQHPSKVRDVLYASMERRLKIQLLFEAEMGRLPTTEELNRYADSVMTIEAIRTDLQSQP